MDGTEDNPPIYIQVSDSRRIALSIYQSDIWISFENLEWSRYHDMDVWSPDIQESGTIIPINCASEFIKNLSKLYNISQF